MSVEHGPRTIKPNTNPIEGERGQIGLEANPQVKIFKFTSDMSNEGRMGKRLVEVTPALSK